MKKTRVCDMLGIEYPIFQGGMAWISDASLAGAVTNLISIVMSSTFNSFTSEYFDCI